MKKTALICALLFSAFVAVSGARADDLSRQPTPLDQPLAEEKIITIACELPRAPTLDEEPLFASSEEAQSTAHHVYHYRLWLPHGYLENPDKRWPCMFILSPMGNATMGHMAAYLKANGFVVVMLVESKNGQWGPIIGNALAAHDDVIKRVRIQEGMKFATGSSGGARASSVLVQSRPGFCGLILQSAGAGFDKNGRYWIERLREDQGVYVVMLMGTHDFNRSEVKRMRAEIPAWRFHAIEFDGGHGWSPASVFEQGMNWLATKVPLSR